MFEMLKTPFKISVVLFVIFLAVSAVQQGALTFSTEFLDEFYHDKIRPALGMEQATGPQPEETLVAPFGASGATPAAAADAGAETGLDKPHMETTKVAEWYATLLSEMMTVDPADYDEKRRALFPVLDGAALQDYDSFLADNNIMAVMQEQDMIMSGFVEDQPSLLRNGNFDGIYRWVYRAPVTVTLMRRGVDNYEDYDVEEEGRNLQLSVQAQIGRIELDENNDGLIIERLRFSRR